MNQTQVEQNSQKLEEDTHIIFLLLLLLLQSDRGNAKGSDRVAQSTYIEKNPLAGFKLPEALREEPTPPSCFGVVERGFHMMLLCFLYRLAQIHTSIMSLLR